MPTLAPDPARARARFTVTVDLPTPPLPLATAMMFFTPFRISLSPEGWVAATCAPTFISTVLTPFTDAAAARASCSIFALSGQAGVVRLSVKATLSPSMLMSCTMLSSTRSFRSSGSVTDRSASRTSSFETIGKNHSGPD